MLELGKAISFALCLLSLYSVLITAFFNPNTSWQQRLAAGLTHLAIAAGVSLASALLFAFPARTNPDRNLPPWKTLPLRVFFIAAITLSLLFLLTWYLRCGSPDQFTYRPDCS